MKKVDSVKNSNLIPLQRANPLIKKGYDTIIADWLGRFSSIHTVRVYRHCITEFLRLISKCDDSLTQEAEIDLLTQFLLLDEKSAYELVSHYQGFLIEQKLAPTTINRKLASIKSFVNYAELIGKCHYSLDKLKSISVTIYRDTTGISSESFKEMLNSVDRSTIKGKRDYAILLLLWGNALRRSEVTSCQIKHFEPREKRLWIFGKGKKGQLQTVSLGEETIKAIQIWLLAREDEEDQISKKAKNLKILNSPFSILHSDDPLFCAVHKGYWGHKLNTDSIYKLVQKYANLAGIEKTLSPHRLRHSAITAALEATNGDVRAVQKLSRHSSLNTLMIYDDNRRNEQKRVTNILESLL